jgi:essential nuclear protein 1
VVDGLAEHFIILSNTYKGRRDHGQCEKLPVLWHQSLLVFAQRYILTWAFMWTACDSNIRRYGADITPEQKDALLDVIRVSHHPQISPEIRRELVNSVARGEPRPDIDVEMR